MKYLIGVSKDTVFIHPIVFSDDVVHRDAAKALPKKCFVLGAGFCNPRDEKFTTWGRSDSLDIEPSESDTAILALFLKGGLSGLQLHNHFAFLEIQMGKQA
jgi:hypothetical protein